MPPVSKDRTGIVAPLLQRLLGVDHASVLARYLGDAPPLERSAVLAREYFDLADGVPLDPVRAALMLPCESAMLGVLVALGEPAEVASYLQPNGLETATIGRLRARLLV